MTINSKQHQAEFMPVYDGRNAKIRGLWKRGDKFYARLSIAYPGEDHPKVKDYWDALKQHPRFSPVTVFTASENKLKREHGQEMVWLIKGTPTDHNQHMLAIRRACKFGVDYVVNFTPGRVHFVLDGIDDVDVWSGRLRACHESIAGLKAQLPWRGIFSSPAAWSPRSAKVSWQHRLLLSSRRVATRSVFESSTPISMSIQGRCPRISMAKSM